MFGSNRKVEVDVLEAQSEALFNILQSHGVFGEIEGKWLEVEQRSFKGMVQSHAESGDRHYLELTYSSCVRLIINLTVNNKHQAVFRAIDAYDHPWENKAINYEALNADLHTVLSTVPA